MSAMSLNRYAASIIAAALLAACGGSQPLIAPGYMPQTRAVAPAGNGVDRIQAAASYRVLHKFEPSDGENPEGGLIRVKSQLYGTTFSGGSGSCGSGGCGTVYKLSKHGVETVLHDFGVSPDGINPFSGVINVNGTLYGTTVAGGRFSHGTVYSISTSGKEKVLYSFAGGSDGANPVAGLINVNGTLYGTTQSGGVNSQCGGSGCGTVFSLTAGGKEKVLYSFKGGSDGVYPFAPLIDVDGTLYGTTYIGGGSPCSYGGCGIVFTVNASGAEKVLYRFKGGSDGSGPQGSLIDLQGTLYGTTAYGAHSGCVDGCGSVYRISLTGKEKVLHRFGSGSDGLRPDAGLTEVNGKLYGTTESGGGPGQNGTIYSITTSGTEKVVYRLSGYEGKYPTAPLLDVNGRLYSTTSAGGNGTGSGYGTVFVLMP